MIKKYDEYTGLGLHILAFFQSPKGSVKKYVGSQNPPFPLIPDPKRVVYDAYGVESSLGGFIKGGLRLKDAVSAAKKGFLPGKVEGSATLIPADFLIGPDFIIEKAFYGKDIGDHIPFEDIERWLGRGDRPGRIA